MVLVKSSSTTRVRHGSSNGASLSRNHTAPALQGTLTRASSGADALMQANSADASWLMETKGQLRPVERYSLTTADTLSSKERLEQVRSIAGSIAASLTTLVSDLDSEEPVDGERQRQRTAQQLRQREHMRDISRTLDHHMRVHEETVQELEAMNHAAPN